jgi:hypothetical protein
VLADSGTVLMTEKKFPYLSTKNAPDAASSYLLYSIKNWNLFSYKRK